ncbi:MAG TPA: hypothetical protein VEK07_10190 [Polyangiaceae bacterium]|nr:hypothetical protein [Polyangiaceae bacterium]
MTALRVLIALGATAWVACSSQTKSTSPSYCGEPVQGTATLYPTGTDAGLVTEAGLGLPPPPQIASDSSCPGSVDLASVNCKVPATDCTNYFYCDGLPSPDSSQGGVGFFNCAGTQCAGTLQFADFGTISGTGGGVCNYVVATFTL